MSRVSAYYHIVFCTKRRCNAIPLDLCEDLYRYIWKEVQQMGCRLIRVGGVQNHVHMLVDLHPTVALSDLVLAVKAHSSRWMHTDSRFESFDGWAKEYYASTIAPDSKSSLIEYIKNQQIHHRGTTLDKELEWLCFKAGLALNPADMT